jgi:hypothetical protein
MAHWNTQFYKGVSFKKMNEFEKVPPIFDVSFKKNFRFEAILVLNILHCPHTCWLTFLSIGGPFFTKLALVNFLKRIFWAMKFYPFLAMCNSQVVYASV